MQTLKKLIAPLALLSLISASLIAWQNRWELYDYFRLRGYDAPARVVALADHTTMDPNTRRIFYSYRPSILEKDSFRESCPTGEVTIVLGCYVSGDGIYLQEIDDERLAGVVEVTAAHEVLHAAYERLSGDEKNRVDRLLNSAFEEVDNKRIIKNVDEYRNSGADVSNELHSILGTEVRELPNELEEYYSQYFTDRQKIVKYSEDYETAFTDLRKQVEKYDKQLELLKNQIDQIQSIMSGQESQLQSERQRLNQLLENDKTEEYNAAVPGFNALVNSYNTNVNQVRGLISQYNDVVEKRNNIVVEQGELIEAIDSRPQTITQ